jgi:hypothetical protein
MSFLRAKLNTKKWPKKNNMWLVLQKNEKNNTNKNHYAIGGWWLNEQNTSNASWGKWPCWTSRQGEAQ